MSLLTGSGVGRYFGAQDVFVNLSFSIEHGDHIGLVGANGEGKTTLLGVLAGLDRPTSGAIHRKNGLRIGYLPQDPPTHGEGDPTVWDSMLQAFSDVRKLEAEVAVLAGELESGGNAELKRYSALQAELERRDGYTYEHRIGTVLHGLGFDDDEFGMPVSHLSGGQRTRLLLARLLLEDPELLLLDEPTNYLDLQAIEWLEAWLGRFAGAIVTVSHDRYFLDAVTSRTWELAFRRLETYRGGYTQYARQRKARYEVRLKEWQAQQEYVEKTEEFIRRFLAGQRTKEAQGRRTRLMRYLRDDAVDKPESDKRIHMHLAPVVRTGDIVLKFEELVAGYDDKPIVRMPDIELRRGQRIALVGPNGSGKTTLVKTILGEIEALAGGVRHGSKVQVGYLPQVHDYLNDETTALEAIWEVSPESSAEELRTLLGSLLLSGDDAFKRIEQLSGGERSRVALARLVLQGANLLILDEPTNHLDIASQEVLEGVLGNFDGTVLLVSHDRYLIQKLAQHVWSLEDGSVHCFEGNWQEFAAARAASSLEAARTAGAAPGEGRQARREEHRQSRRARKEEQRMVRRQAELEREIHDVEAEKERLGEEIGTAGEQQDLTHLHDLTEKYQAIDARLKQLWAEWEGLSSQLES